MLYNCPHCNQEYEIELEYNGMHLQCEKCEKYFKVQLEQPTANNKKTIATQNTLQTFASGFKTLFKKTPQQQTDAEPTLAIRQNSKTICPMCYGEIPADAFKCMHCGEILKTKSGRPVVDRVGYLIWGLTFGMLGVHYLFAKRREAFFIHLLMLFVVPLAALTVSKIFGSKVVFLPFLMLFEIAFAIYTMNQIVKDPNK